MRRWSVCVSMPTILAIRTAGRTSALVLRSRGSTYTKGEGHPSPLSTYSAPGGLRQGPGRAAESPAEATADAAEHDDVNPADHQRVRPSRPPRRQGRPGPDRRRRAALRGHRGEPRAVDRRPVRPARRRAQGARRHRPGGAGPRPGDPPADRPAAHPAPLRPRPVPRAHGRAHDDPEPVYVGRLGLTDSAGRRLLVDWRSPAAEPFFGATHANPMGLASRRRYRWTRGRISDYWDEVFTPDGLDGHAPRSTTSPRSSPASAAAGRRGCATCSAPSRPTRTPSSAPGRAARSSSTAVPGTGKTVVALHRTAYLLYSDPRLGHRRGGVLFVGPHQPYLAYVADVLPSLGEEGVQTCTLRDLVPEGRRGRRRDRPRGGPAEVVGATWCRRSSRPSGSTRSRPPRAWRSRPRGPTSGSAPTTGPRRSRRRTPAPRTTRRATRSGRSCSRSWSTSTTSDDDGADRSCPPVAAQNDELRDRPSTGPGRCSRPTDLVGDLWSVPAYLRMCAPWLEPDEVRTLQREDAQAWTVSDLPLLDAARQRLGDPEASRRRRRHEAAVAAERERDGRRRRRPDRGRRLRRCGVMSMLRRRGPAGRAGRRGRAARAPTRTCSPARSRTSSWTRRRS